MVWLVLQIETPPQSHKEHKGGTEKFPKNSEPAENTLFVTALKTKKRTKHERKS